MFLCPWCGYPTLHARRVYDICLLCSWEDDGQDNMGADIVRGGLNSDYSLTEAPENFRKYLIMFRPADTNAFAMSNVKKNYAGKVIPDKLRLKKDIIKKYNELYSRADDNHVKTLWEEILTLEKKLGRI